MPSDREQINRPLTHGESRHDESQQGGSHEENLVGFMKELDRRTVPKRTVLNTIGVPLASTGASVAGFWVGINGHPGLGRDLVAGGATSALTREAMAPMWIPLLQTTQRYFFGGPSRSSSVTEEEAHPAQSTILL